MSPDDFRQLVAAGLSAEQIAVVMEMMNRDARLHAEAVSEMEEARKAAQRARWRKHQQTKKNANVSSREPTLANVPRERDTRVEDITLPTEIEPQKKKQTNAPTRDVCEFRDELSELDTERLDAIIKHRKAKRGQITGHAARLFRADASACGISLAVAVDTCISRNWITVKPDWLEPRQQARGSPPGRRTLDDVANDLIAKMDRANEDPTAENPGYPAPPLRLSAAGW